MAAPDPYSRNYDYTLLAPSTLPDAGTRLNADLDEAAAATAAIIARAALIQRDDGAPRNATVTLDSMTAAAKAYLGGWTTRGAWITARAYIAKDLVTQGGRTYVCNTAHTAGTFATDLAAGKWMLLAGNGAVSIYDFGAVGDGTADDTAAWQAALGTGRTVFDPYGGTYKITGQLTLAGIGQRIVGAGAHATAFTPSGTFTLFSVTSARGAGIEHVYLDCTNQTGGFVLALNNANRSTFTDIKTYKAYNFCYITSTNNVTFRDIYCANNRGDYSFRYEGPGSTRSDNVNMFNVMCDADPGSTPIGFDWNGNCFSVRMYGVGFLSGHSKGIWMRNTVGGDLDPRFLNAFQVALENCEHGLMVDAGLHVNLHAPYIAGASVGAGIKVYAGAAANSVKVHGGLIYGSATYGIDAPANACVPIGVDFSGNTSGETSTVQRVPVSGIKLDTNAYWNLSSGDPLMAVDSGSYWKYDRAGKFFSFVIDGVAVAYIRANGLQLPTAPTSATGLLAGQIWNSANDARIK